MRDRGLVRAILATALRFRVHHLAAARARGWKGRCRPTPPRCRISCMSAAAQILFLDIPDSAAVDLAVTHAKSDPRTARFSGLVNGVLRGAGARQGDGDCRPSSPRRRRARLVSRPAGRRLWRRQGQADPRRPPGRGAGRLHRQIRSRSAGPSGSAASCCRPAPCASSSSPPPVADLPGFADGAWWVQDAAASLPARLLGDVAGLRVADLCAAPGGKTAQLLLAGAKVTAVDTSKNRLTRLDANLERLGLPPRSSQADAARNTSRTQLFDAVLLDAPCSSTGTVRRHPDVPWTKTPADVAKLADLQRRLLASAVRTGEARRPHRLFQLLARPGRRARRWSRAFLAEHADFALDPIRPDEVAGADAVHRRPTAAAHHAGRSRPRRAGTFRPGRFLRRPLLRLPLTLTACMTLSH